MGHTIDDRRRQLLLGVAGLTGAALTGAETALARAGLSAGTSTAQKLAIPPGAGLSVWPGWRRSMPANTWRTIPASNTIRAINPARNPAYNPYLATNPNDDRGPWGAVGGISNVITTWCGACYDRSDDTLWLPLGGGHQDYAGNEAYAIRLADEVPAWRMPRPPSGSIPLGLINLDDGQESTGNYSDGRPRAIHSYNKHVYVPGRGPFCAVQGSTYRSGQSGTSRSLLLNGATGEWTTLATHPQPAVEYGAACYDATRDTVWWLGAGTAKLSRFNFTTNQWQAFNSGSTSLEWSYHNLTHAPEHDVLVLTSDNLATDFAVWDATTALMTQPGASNTRPPQMTKPGGHSGGAWVPSLNAVAMWHSETAATSGLITLLRAPANPRTQAWTWDTLPLAASNAVLPTLATANGTYGRFGYAPGLDGFYLLNSVDQPVYFYALGAGDSIFANGFQLA